MSFARERLHAFRGEPLDTSRLRVTGFLALALTVGLMVVAPAIGWFAGAFGLTGPLALLAGVAFVGGSYALLILAVDRLALGTVVATVVSATFAADVPLAAGADAYPGSLGPALWLVHAPLVVLVGLLAARGRFTVESLSRVEYALGAFVLWSVVVALLGPVPRRDVALYYALFSLVALGSFAVAARSVAAGVVTLRGVIVAFVVAVGGHVAFATAQVVNGGPFGLSVLGETVRSLSHAVIHLGLLGGFNVGVFVSGLTGGSGPLSVLLVLALPLALAVAVRRTGAQRTGLLLLVVAMAAVLRFTEKDAARAAALIGVSLFVAFLLWNERDRPVVPNLRNRRIVPHGALLLVAVGSLFLPSTAGGGGLGKPAGGRGDVGGPVGDAVVDTSIAGPFFNLNTLDVRLVQYLVGIDVWLRHPIRGVGGGNFRYVAAGYDVPAIEGIAMHNLYLSVLVGTGLPGLLLYSLAIGLVVLAGWRTLRSRERDRTLVAGLLAGVVGFLAVSFWVLPLRFTYTIPFWLLAGALVGDARRTTAADRDPASER